MEVLFGAVDEETRARDVEAAAAAEKKELQIERNEDTEEKTQQTKA